MRHTTMVEALQRSPTAIQPVGLIQMDWKIRFAKVVIKAGIMVKRIPDAQKGSYYTKIFPINTGPLSVDTVNQVRTFAKKIEGIKETNMLTIVEYCFQQMPGEKLWEESGEK